MPEHIHQEITIGATPERIFEVLTDGAAFSAASGGAPAEIEATEGTPFSCFGGMILGRNIEIVAPQRLVQAWRVSTWEPGVYSIVRFELTPQDTGTLLTFDHTGFPAAAHDHLAAGWHTNYWNPLTSYLESKPLRGSA